jgi:hypothetical protein
VTKAWLFLLGLLTQFVTCADRHLDRARWSLDPVPVARGTEVRDAGMIGEQQFVIVGGRWELWEPRAVVRVDAGGKTHPLPLPTRDVSGCRGEALHADGEAWRYSGCSGNGVQFAGSSGSVAFVEEDSTLRAHEWMPFDDAEGGVLLSVGPDRRTAVVKVVTPGGIERTLGSFDRGSDTWSMEPGEAVRLGEERVAIITIESWGAEPVNSSLMLRVFEGEELTTTRIAFIEGSWRSVDAVAGPSGELVVAASPSDRTGIVTMVIDPSRPEAATIHRISGTASIFHDPGVKLIATGGRFAVGWIDFEDRTVRLAEFDARRVLPAMTVGDDAGAPHFPLLSLVHASGEEPSDIAVFWTSNDGNVMMRRLPEPLTGSLLASELLNRLSARIDRLLGRDAGAEP